MIDIERYITDLIALLKQKFSARLLYVGLQGSYLRGEAMDSSDIDIMVVINQLSVADLSEYRTIIQSLKHFDKSCGFICSKADLSNWNPLEICHLCNTTKDYFGALAELVPAYTKQDVRNFVKFSLNTLYHGICHRFVHVEDNCDMAALAADYKGVFFILQNLYYLEHGAFIPTKMGLLPLLDGKNRAVLSRCIALNSGTVCDFCESFDLLFSWCQQTLQTV